jgi:hypothetical protein
LFSSASRAVDFSTSKMPPQQPDRLLDLFYQPFDFGAHDLLGSRGPSWARIMFGTGADVAAERAKRNRPARAISAL